MPEPKAKRRKVREDEESKKSELEETFGVRFNPGMKLLWTWSLNQSPEDPLNCLHSLLNLKLCGPFRYLHKSTTNTDNTDSTAPNTENTAPNTDSTAPNTENTAPNTENTAPNTENTAPSDAAELHMLDREWQCPPEFQPCAQNDTHLFGLWRDAPWELPTFVVEKRKGDHGAITPVAMDTLDLIRVLSKKRKVDLPKDLKKLIEAHASTKDLKRVETTRRKSVVAKTFNKIGIVVPVGKNDLGYRPLTMSYSELDAMLTKSCVTDDEAKKDKILAPFDECINYIQFANDECDYGMGFELGMCVFAHKTSRNFMGTTSSLLPLAYDLLGRNLFSKIMKRICEKEEAQPSN